LDQIILCVIYGVSRYVCVVCVSCVLCVCVCVVCRVCRRATRNAADRTTVVVGGAAG
jgi:hypothetical protein